MNFGQALEALEQGKRVAREGWNGKGMWLAYTEGSVIPVSAARSGACLHFANSLDSDATITIGGHIDMKTAQDTIECGWKPTTMDMITNDWITL